MGNRISISFSKGDRQSVCLFSHWRGTLLVQQALEYLARVKQVIAKDKIRYPLTRLEPETVMVDFIRDLTKDMDMVRSDLYLGATTNDGDDSDNGHWEIPVEADLKEVNEVYAYNTQVYLDRRAELEREMQQDRERS